NDKEREQMEPRRHGDPALLRLQQERRSLSPQPELLSHAAHRTAAIRQEAMAFLQCRPQSRLLP
ncbi:hypothetical protein AB4043_21800, partial [Terriglobus sp. YAF25]|uniref:hypothetical protein n=1 Tax=Terriglobus sp. YAF25 TaxID=3233080 RepID=UPI003F9C2772